MSSVKVTEICKVYVLSHIQYLPKTLSCWGEKLLISAVFSTYVGYLCG
jgi:hypothetical protein